MGQNGLAVIADGPDEMRAAVSRHIDLGADQVKLTMSGEEICEPLSSEQCYYTDEETAVCVEVAHARGRRLCAHARFVALFLTAIVIPCNVPLLIWRTLL